MSKGVYSWQPPHFGQTTLAFLSAICCKNAEKTWPQPLQTRFTLSSPMLSPAEPVCRSAGSEADVSTVDEPKAKTYDFPIVSSLANN
jgi:hypothetical protein